MLINWNWLFLGRHLDFFEMVRAEDEKEIAKRFDGVSKTDTCCLFSMDQNFSKNKKACILL